MKIVNTSSAVRNISMNSPWVIDVPPPRDTLTVKGPGNRHETMAAAVIPPRICATAKRVPLIHGTAPTRHSPRVTL